MSDELVVDEQLVRRLVAVPLPQPAHELGDLFDHARVPSSSCSRC